MTRIITKVPDLQRIAAMNVAVCLWKHVDDLPFAVWQKNKFSNNFNSISIDILQLTRNMSLPKSITELIEGYVKKIHDEIVKWVHYHGTNVFFDYYCYHLICHFDRFVWYPDGTVDNVQTARNIQTSFRLNELEKFRFLCQYCLKDEIEPKWKSLRENKVFDSVPFEKFPLLFYWNCYCRNGLQNIPSTEGLSIDEFMFRHILVDNWPAKKYFFDRMNVDEQIQNAIWIIDSGSPSFQKFIIGKLNRTQRTTVYANRSMTILMNYAKIPVDFDYILSAWYDAVKIITGNDFLELLRELLRKKVDFPIVSEIWISAPVEFKLRVLNSNTENVIDVVWKLWLKFYDHDSFEMFLDTSENIRKKIREMKIFKDHCKNLLLADKFTTLKGVLGLCFSKSDDLTPIKRFLLEPEGWLSKHCENLILKKKASALDQLCNFFSDVIDLNTPKKNLVEVEFFNEHCKNLVKNGEIPELEKLLNVCFSNVEESKRSVRNLFDTASFFSLCDNSVIEYKLSELDKIMEFFCYGVEESSQFRRSLVTKSFFVDHCLELISRGEISNRENVLGSFFPRVEESVRFKRNLKEKIIFGDYCLKLITKDELPKMDQLLKFFLSDDEESAHFKENISRRLISSGESSKLKMFLNSSLFPSIEDKLEFRRDLARKKFFREYWLKLITDDKLPDLSVLLNSMYDCSPYDRANLEQNMENDAFRANLKQDMANDHFFYVHCRKLIEGNRLSKLDDLLSFFFFDGEKLSEFKKHLVDGDTFHTLCENFIASNDLTALKKLLSWGFSYESEMRRYKENLANSENVKKTCLQLYAKEQMKILGDFLDFLFSSRFELEYEYKRNLLLSDEGVRVCLDLIDRPKKTAYDAMTCCYPYYWWFDFEKAMIFSPAAISYLSEMMLRNQYQKVEKCINRYLRSEEDRAKLKMQLVNTTEPNELITTWFFKPNEYTCLSFIKWWLSGKKALRDYKKKLSVNAVFEAGLRMCLFRSSDSCGEVCECAPMKDLNLKSLDRFLLWYFVSSKKIKEYKVLKIGDEGMETIRFLLENHAKIAYFGELLNWFFENDKLEIARFKKRMKKLRKLF